MASGLTPDATHTRAQAVKIPMIEPARSRLAQNLPIDQRVAPNTRLFFRLPAAENPIITNPTLTFDLVMNFNIPAQFLDTNNSNGLGGFNLCTQLDPFLGVYPLFPNILWIAGNNAVPLESVLDTTGYIHKRLAEGTQLELTDLQRRIGANWLHHDNYFNPTLAAKPYFGDRCRFQQIVGSNVGGQAVLQVIKKIEAPLPFCHPTNWPLQVYGDTTLDISFSPNLIGHFYPQTKIYSAVIGTSTDCDIPTAGTGLSAAAISAVRLNAPNMATTAVRNPGHPTTITLSLNYIPLTTSDYNSMVGSPQLNNQWATALTAAGVGNAGSSYPNTDITNGCTVYVRIGGMEPYGVLSPATPVVVPPVAPGGWINPAWAGRPLLTYQFVKYYFGKDSISTVTLDLSNKQSTRAQTGVNQQKTIAQLGEKGKVLLTFATVAELVIPLPQCFLGPTVSGFTISTNNNVAVNQTDPDDPINIGIGDLRPQYDINFEIMVVEGSPQKWNAAVTTAVASPNTFNSTATYNLAPTSVYLDNVVLYYNRPEVDPEWIEKVESDLASTEGFSVSYPTYFTWTTPINTALTQTLQIPALFDSMYMWMFETRIPGYVGNPGVYVSSTFAPFQEFSITVDGQQRLIYYSAELALTYGCTYPRMFCDTNQPLPTGGNTAQPDGATNNYRIGITRGSSKMNTRMASDYADGFNNMLYGSPLADESYRINARLAAEMNRDIMPYAWNTSGGAVTGLTNAIIQAKVAYANQLQTQDIDCSAVNNVGQGVIVYGDNLPLLSTTNSFSAQFNVIQYTPKRITVWKKEGQGISSGAGRNIMIAMG